MITVRGTVVYAASRHARPGTARWLISTVNLQPGDAVVLWCRVSHESQTSHLDDQERQLRELVEQHGARTVSAVCHVGPGTDPTPLRSAVAIARRCNAVVLAESTDRFIRSARFHSTRRPNVRASDHDLRRLAEITRGVRLMTIVDPDAPTSEVHAYRTRRGQLASGNPGGRPRRPDGTPGRLKRRRERLFQEVLRLHSAEHSSRAIAKLIEDEMGIRISHRTVQIWTRQGGNFS